ncbi:MAG: winged helix-turn-helix domain-containing protein [Halobacteriota archaeon]|nr:winged helix-turn-helix domain-containing protein [Halobacteriota archaeon]
MQAEFYDFYEKASDWLRLLARSEIRIKILANLNEGVKNLGELREVLDLSSSTILHGMRGMELEALIENTATGYALTNIGKIQTILINDLIKSIAVLSKDRDFWLNHDISGIPEHLLKRIGELNDYEFVRSTPEDLLKTMSNYLYLVMKAKEVKGVSVVFAPQFPSVFKKLVKEKADVQLILTREVMAKTLETSRGILESLIPKPNFRLWEIDEEVKVAFSVTDSFLSFGLLRNDGTYDFDADLIAHDNEALNWARDLFEYYRKRSKMIGLDDI